MVTKVTGGCQCRTVRYELTGEPQMLYVCHCLDCQKQSSSAFGMSLRVDPENIKYQSGEDSLKIWITRGEDGGIKKCAFCRNCGTRIFHGSDNLEEPVSIKAGSLDDTRWLKPIAHIWLRSSQRWLSIKHDQTHCFEKEIDDEGELSRQWKLQSKKTW